MRSGVWVLLVIVLTGGCKNIDRVDAPKDEVLGRLRADIQFSITPGTGSATGLFRFMATQNGTGISLPGADLLLNGVQIIPDSTEMSGVYYEVHLELAEFFTDHIIEVRKEGQSYRQKFSVAPFSLPSGITAPSTGHDMVLTVQGVNEGESLLVMMVDTSFENEDLQQELMVRNNRVVISAAELNKLTPGPVAAEVHFEEKIPARELPFRKGTITLRQAVSAEFLLPGSQPGTSL